MASQRRRIERRCVRSPRSSGEVAARRGGTIFGVQVAKWRRPTLTPNEPMVINDPLRSGRMRAVVGSTVSLTHYREQMQRPSLFLGLVKVLGDVQSSKWVICHVGQHAVFVVVAIIVRWPPRNKRVMRAA